MVPTLGALGVLCAGTAHAEWYVGGSVGQSSIDVGEGEIEDAFLIDDDFVATGTSLDETDTGWKAFAGYDITPVIAVEAAYANLGEATFLTTIESAPPPNDAIVPFDILGTATADGFQASALFQLPLGPFAAFAKLGAFRWEAEFTEEIIETGALRVERTEAEIDALYGAGCSWTLPDPSARASNGNGSRTWAKASAAAAAGISITSPRVSCGGSDGVRQALKNANARAGASLLSGGISAAPMKEVVPAPGVEPGTY